MHTPISPRRPVILAAALLACGAPSDETAGATDTDTTGAQTSETPTSTSATTSEDITTGTSTTSTTSITSASSDTSDITTDATTGPPVEDCADLPLCDDFEGAAPGGPPDPSLWQVVSPDCSGSGKLAVADDQAHGGSRSLRVDGGGGYCDHVFIAHTAAIEQLGPVWYARFFVRLDAPLADGHVTFVALNDENDNDGELRMGGQAKILMWNRASDDATLPVLSPAGIALSTPLPAQQWSCVEFMIDETAGAMRTWVDGAEVEGLHIDGEPTPEIDQQWHNKPDWKPLVTDFKLGWESYAGSAMVLYFDDIALSSAPIGCG